MKIDQYFPGFVRTKYRYNPDLKRTAEQLLLGPPKESTLTGQYGYEELDYLKENIAESVRNRVRGKDTAIQVYKDLVEYLKAQGIPIEMEFPPIQIDNSFERQMFIAKYLQEPNSRISRLPGILWVSERTLENDIAKLRGITDDPLQICGKPFIIPETSRTNDHLRFASTVHPFFLTENLTQVIVMLEGLKRMAEDPQLEYYALHGAREIWVQLSDYARNRILKVLQEILPTDTVWYDRLSLNSEGEKSFYLETDCSVHGNVLIDCLKNEKPFYIKYQEGDEIKDLQVSLFIRSRNVFDWENGEIEVEIDGERKVLLCKNILFSAYTWEEILAC